MGGVIITSGKFWCALAVMRSLGGHGIKVACGEIQGTAPPAAFFSRYCKRRFFYPSFKTQPEDFVDAICDFANKHQEFDVLMPTADETYTISKYIDYIKSRSPHLKIPLHLYRYINFANDKQKIYELATKMRVPIPQTLFPSSIEELITIKERITYPALIKIRSGSGGLGTTHISDWQKMVAAYEETVKKFSLNGNNLPIMQEYIPGIDYGVAALFNQGELKAKVVFKALKSVPPSGGMMVSRVSIQNEQMENYLITLAHDMHWHGVIMADFRLDERDNTPKLLDVNPRFWFSLYQAVAAGVDFPYLLYRIAIDNNVTSVEDYTIGVRTGYMWACANNLFTHLHETKNCPKAVNKDREFNTTKFEDLSFRDPLPSMAIYFNAAVSFAKTRQWFNFVN
jgi:predicted ATP-grasp superfamily ATP-dependent carboligase